MHHEDHDQALAAALAALLLVGITLIVREIAGLWPATAWGMGTVLVAFWGPAAVRRILVWHQVRRFRRHIGRIAR